MGILVKSLAIYEERERLSELEKEVSLTPMVRVSLLAMREALSWVLGERVWTPTKFIEFVIEEHKAASADTELGCAPHGTALGRLATGLEEEDRGKPCP